MSQPRLIDRPTRPFLEFSQYRKSIEFSNELDSFLNRLLNRHPGCALLFSSALHSAPTLQDAFNYSKSVAAEAERIALPGGSEGQIDLLRGNSVRHAKRATCLSWSITANAQEHIQSVHDCSNHPFHYHDVIIARSRQRRRRRCGGGRRQCLPL